jgi:peroxiredoxin
MAKIPFKTGFLCLLLIAVIFTPGLFAAGSGLDVGETSPNPEFRYFNSDQSSPRGTISNLYDYKGENTLLIAFMPDISEGNNYADVMISAFDTYFAEGLGFDDQYNWEVNKSRLKVLVVSKNDESAIREYIEQKNIDFDMATDINMDAANSFGINSWTSPNDGSSVYVIDKDNKVTYASYDYKGEGEKLRGVQKEIFTQLNFSELYSALVLNDKIMMPGDIASDFEFSYVDQGKDTFYGLETKTAKLSDYIGKKNVIIAFYPAPFSMSCMKEAKTFDSYAEKQTLQNFSNSNLGGNEDLEILMVSNSGMGVLKSWGKDLSLQNVKLISDYSGVISSAYASFNPKGYNNRTLFIVDKSGKLSYVDWDYQVNETDFSKVTDHLQLISEK